MLNVVTVHWNSAKWIDPQLDYLERNIDEPFRVFAALHGIEPQFWKRFYHAEDLGGSHPMKLNTLAELAIEQSDPGDTLMFIDGDALPVRPLSSWIRSVLDAYPLAAVRRDENLGDPQPHPCFSVTTCGFWQEIGGDWREGVTWTNSLGDAVTDPGGNLMKILEERNIEWLPLLRTNTNNAHHPVWFAVYDHRVYHHGAGFRERHSRLDTHEHGAPPSGPTLQGLMMQVVRKPSRVSDIRVAEWPQAARMTVVKHKTRQYRRKDPFETSVFKRLQSDPEFYLEFDATELS